MQRFVCFGTLTYRGQNGKGHIMTKKVLIVGQCSFDYGSIAQLLSALSATAVKVDLHVSTIGAIKEHSPSLILVNRINDNDGTSGVALIKELRSNSSFNEIPIMLVSNYEEAQREALEVGAIKGFGKSSLGSEETQRLLKEVLEP